MTVINLAFTAPVNPSGATPVLTEGQVWEGFKIKVKQPSEFIPAILECKVISEEGNTIIREAIFKSDGPTGRSDPVREECVHYPPSRAHFKQPNGTVIQNVISQNSDGELFVTFVFEFHEAEIEAGSTEEAEKRKVFQKMSKMAVEGTINATRRLVEEGKIQ